MQDRLAREEGAVTLSTIYRAARGTHLDLDRFFADLSAHKHGARVTRDVVSADDSGVTGTPAFFINGRRYTGAYDPDSLTTQVQQALEAGGLAENEDGATDLDPLNP
jgi:protein-disulfide isomerase